MTRKRRSRTLAQAHYVESAPSFAPSEEYWKIIGGKYCDLTEADRITITRVVEDYLRDRLFETHVKSLSKMAEHLEKIHKSAGSLYRAIGKNADDPAGISDLALQEITSRMSAGVQSRHCLDRPLTPEDVLGFVASIAVAANLARGEIESDKTPEIKVHDAWRKLVWRIMDLIDGKGLRVTTSKESYYSKNWPSPFVKFFDRLQKSFPKDAREFASDHALSDALDRVRRARCNLGE
ncbi:hypothetical protein AMST5_00717 [freshwater sediment metagenome]|uniref:Uncharacterized protein n=1 Tax=freshwater sediment metagenome TaxID=556182 RepID=A0AA48M080_9ZZZZ